MQDKTETQKQNRLNFSFSLSGNFFLLQFVNFDPKFCESLEKAFLDLLCGAGIQVLKTGVSCAMSFLAKIRLRLNKKGCVYNIVQGYSQLLLVVAITQRTVAKEVIAY